MCAERRKGPIRDGINLSITPPPYAPGQLSHKVALYVVMPIGSTTTLSNYILHKNLPLAALSSAGLTLIFGSNYPSELLPAVLQESRMWNTMGCAMLIGSSYLSHKLEGAHSHAPGGQEHAHGHKTEGEEKEAAEEKIEKKEKELTRKK